MDVATWAHPEEAGVNFNGAGFHAKGSWSTLSAAHHRACQATEPAAAAALYVVRDLIPILSLADANGTLLRPLQ